MMLRWFHSHSFFLPSRNKSTILKCFRHLTPFSNPIIPTTWGSALQRVHHSVADPNQFYDPSNPSLTFLIALPPQFDLETLQYARNAGPPLLLSNWNASQQIMLLVKYFCLVKQQVVTVGTFFTRRDKILKPDLVRWFCDRMEQAQALHTVPIEKCDFRDASIKWKCWLEVPNNRCPIVDLEERKLDGTSEEARLITGDIIVLECRHSEKIDPKIQAALDRKNFSPLVQDQKHAREDIENSNNIRNSAKVQLKDTTQKLSASESPVDAEMAEDQEQDEKEYEDYVRKEKEKVTLHKREHLLENVWSACEFKDYDAQRITVKVVLHAQTAKYSAHGVMLEESSEETSHPVVTVDRRWPISYCVHFIAQSAQAQLHRKKQQKRLQALLDALDYLKEVETKWGSASPRGPFDASMASPGLENGAAVASTNAVSGSLTNTAEHASSSSPVTGGNANAALSPQGLLAGAIGSQNMVMGVRTPSPTTENATETTDQKVSKKRKICPRQPGSTGETALVRFWFLMRKRFFPLGQGHQASS